MDPLSAVAGAAGSPPNRPGGPRKGGEAAGGANHGASDTRAPGPVLEPAPFVLIPGALVGPVAKRLRRTKAPVYVTAAASTAPAEVWAYQEQLRAEVLPRSRRLEATAARLTRVAERLAEGATVDDCRAVLESVAARVKEDPDQGQWFNGETTWRRDNFDRELGRVGTDGRRGPRGVLDVLADQHEEIRRAAGGGGDDGDPK